MPAPLDIPVVSESLILSPGESSEAPREVGALEFFICVPGAKSEAPFVPDGPAKLKPEDPIRIAAAAIINVFFMSLVSIVWVASPNVGRIKRFVPIGILSAEGSVPSAKEPIKGLKRRNTRRGQTVFRCPPDSGHGSKVYEFIPNLD